MLPSRSWNAYEHTLRCIGERRSPAGSRELPFLRAIGLLTARGDLTPAGNRYFVARFIKNDEKAAVSVLRDSLLEYPPVAAIVQYLAGVVGATREAAKTILRAQGFGEHTDDRQMGSLLTLMAHAGLVTYGKRDSSILITVRPPTAEKPLEDVFISPQTPYGNRQRLKQVLAGCEGHICWLDKHFMPMAFEALWEVAMGSSISKVGILSLRLQDHSSKSVSRDYRDLRRELANRSIEFEWRVVDSTVIRQTHDRWIIGSSQAWNVPNVGAIYSGQHSEISRSEHVAELQKIFDNYWSLAKSFLQEPVKVGLDQSVGAISI